MNVETDDMRLQFLKDFGVTDCAFTDTSGGTTATITALLRKDYVEVEGEVGVESNVICVCPYFRCTEHSAGRHPLH